MEEKDATAIMGSHDEDEDEDDERTMIVVMMMVMMDSGEIIAFY